MMVLSFNAIQYCFAQFVKNLHHNWFGLVGVMCTCFDFQVLVPNIVHMIGN
jgi:hypothetical protein